MVAPKLSCGALDWVAVRQRLTAAMEATESLLNPPPEKRRQILEARAITLAASRASKRKAGASSTAIVSFVLTSNRFAIETRYVCGVVALQEVTPLPRTPDYVMGIYDLRGQLVPVIDLRAALGVTADTSSPLRWAIACGATEPEFLIAADAISNIANLPADFRAQPEEDVAWVLGVIADGTTILDGAALLNDRRFFLNDRPGARNGNRDGKP